MRCHLMSLFWLGEVDESFSLHLVPESLGDDRVGQLDVGGHARRLARRQSHGLDLGEQEAAGGSSFGKIKIVAMHK